MSEGVMTGVTGVILMRVGVTLSKGVLLTCRIPPTAVTCPSESGGGMMNDAIHHRLHLPANIIYIDDYI